MREVRAAAALARPARRVACARPGVARAAGRDSRQGDRVARRPTKVNERVAPTSRASSARQRLPEKLLLIHHVHPRHDPRQAEAGRWARGVAMPLNVDGFGTPAERRAKYPEFTRRPRLDPVASSCSTRRTPAWTPSQVLALRPRPQLSCTSAYAAAVLAEPGSEAPAELDQRPLRPPQPLHGRVPDLLEGHRARPGAAVRGAGSAHADATPVRLRRRDAPGAVSRSFPGPFLVGRPLRGRGGRPLPGEAREGAWRRARRRVGRRQPAPTRAREWAREDLPALVAGVLEHLRPREADRLRGALQTQPEAEPDPGASAGSKGRGGHHAGRAAHRGAG